MYVSQLTDTLRNMLVIHSAWTETMFATFQNIHTPFKLLIYAPFTFQSTKIFADFISDLSLFWSREQVEKWLGSVAKLVETTANAIALHPAVRSYWDKALFALLFMPVNDEKTGSSPMWLQLNSLTRTMVALFESPEEWESDLNAFVTRYRPRLQLFLKALRNCEDRELRRGSLTESQRLSDRMARSIDDGLFWFCLAARKSFMHEIYWSFLDEKQFGPLHRRKY